MTKVISIVLNDFQNDSRVLKENVSLQNAGYDVKVVALWENGVKEFETVSNISIHRVKLKSKDWSKNKFIQIIKYFEFIYKVTKIYKDNDIFHCNDLNALPIGVLIKLFFNKNAKIVYDAHEHESFRAGYDRTMHILSQWWEGKLIKYADRVITVSYSIADDYEKMYNIKKPDLVLNTPLYQKIERKNIFREKFNIPESDIIFLYQGGLSPKRGIIEFADIIKDIKNISYIIMGYGILENDIKELSLKNANVHFHKAVSSNVLLDYTSSADIGVCIEENICKSWDYALPNKMFEYLLAGLPVFVGGLGEMKRFVKKYDVGYIIEDLNNKKDVQKMIDKIIREHQTKFDNIKQISKQFTWQEQEKVLLKVYKDL